MNKHRCVMCLASVGAVILVSVLAYNLCENCPIRYNRFDEIRIGMTEADVEDLLGCPSGDWSTGPTEFKSNLMDGSAAWIDFPPLDLAEDLERRKRFEWMGDRGVIYVFFDGDGKVALTAFSPGQRVPPRWWQHFQWILYIDRTHRLT